MALCIFCSAEEGGDLGAIKVYSIQPLWPASVISDADPADLKLITYEKDAKTLWRGLGLTESSSFQVSPSGRFVCVCNQANSAQFQIFVLDTTNKDVVAVPVNIQPIINKAIQMVPPGEIKNVSSVQSIEKLKFEGENSLNGVLRRASGSEEVKLSFVVPLTKADLVIGNLTAKLMNASN